MNVFGFSTAPSGGGDFTPIVKFDARAGRMFRMDRIENNGNFETEAVDVTQSFKAIADFENIESGWLHFAPGTAPDFKLVPIGKEIPARPSLQHKPGVRFMLKLSKEFGADKPVREIAGTAKAFVSGVEEIYHVYLKDKAANPGKLPVIVLEKTTPIKTGSGEKVSTNYQPVFRIVGWASRGDLTFVPKATAPTQGPLPQVNSATPPSTGSNRAEAPSEEDEMAEDFGD